MWLFLQFILFSFFSWGQGEVWTQVWNECISVRAPAQPNQSQWTPAASEPGLSRQNMFGTLTPPAPGTIVEMVRVYTDEQCRERADEAQREFNRARSFSNMPLEEDSFERSSLLRDLPGSSAQNARPTSNTPQNSKQGQAGNQKQESQGGQGSPTSNGTSMADLELDVQNCTSSFNQANKCCNNPTSCGATQSTGGMMPPPSNDPEGMRAYCQQMQYAGTQNSTSNANAAGICFSNRDNCSYMCNAAVTKWQQKLSSCVAPACDPSRVNQAIALLRSRSQHCDRLESVQSVLAAQSSSSNDAAYQAALCAQQSGINPASQMPQEGSVGSASVADTGVDCAAYPNSPLCINQDHQGLSGSNYGSLEESADTSSPTLELGTSAYNVDVTSEYDSLPSFEPIEAQPSQVHLIPNGGGGMLGGGSSLGGTGFGLDEDGSLGREEGYNTDVLQGERSGGGFTTGGSLEPANTAGFGGYGISNSLDEYKNKLSGLDLKQYLPGGAKDPTRGLASTGVLGGGTGHADIAPAGVSIFNRITLRMSTMCRLKQLLGCD